MVVKRALIPIQLLETYGQQSMAIFYPDFFQTAHVITYVIVSFKTVKQHSCSNAVSLFERDLNDLSENQSSSKPMIQVMTNPRIVAMTAAAHAR